MGVLRLDHLAVKAESLEAGVAHVEAALGVALAPGGQHVLMGTHNRLLSLGSDIYLEVIATDPSLPEPGRARWFDLDNFKGVPRLGNWIARSDDLTAAMLMGPAVPSDVLDFARGDLRWKMVVPRDGQVAFDGAFPALISWQGDLHPSQLLPDSGCRLRRLMIVHPMASTLRKHLDPVVDLNLVHIEQGAEFNIEAEIQTPTGMRLL